MTHHEARELLSVLGEIRHLDRKIVIACEAHDVLESDVERHAVDILKFLQFLSGTQIEHGKNTSFADHRHLLLQRADVQAPHGIIDS